MRPTRRLWHIHEFPVIGCFSQDVYQSFDGIAAPDHLVSLAWYNERRYDDLASINCDFQVVHPLRCNHIFSTANNEYIISLLRLSIHFRMVASAASVHAIDPLSIIALSVGPFSTWTSS